MGRITDRADNFAKQFVKDKPAPPPTPPTRDEKMAVLLDKWKGDRRRRARQAAKDNRGNV